MGSCLTGAMRTMLLWRLQQQGRPSQMRQAATQTGARIGSETAVVVRASMPYTLPARKFD